MSGICNGQLRNSRFAKNRLTSDQAHRSVRSREPARGRCGMKQSFIIAAMCVVCGAIPASAHHSLAAYNMGTYKTVEGTVKSFQWMNPHAKLSLVVVNDAGRTAQWEV